MEATNTPIYDQLSFLAESMRRLLGDGDDTDIPLPLRRKGVLVEIQEQAFANAQVGKATDEKLTAFIATQLAHNASAEERMTKVEQNQHRIRRTILRCGSWTLKRSEEGKLLWHRVATGATLLLVAGHRLYIWTPVAARKIASIVHSIYP